MLISLSSKEMAAGVLILKEKMGSVDGVVIVFGCKEKRTTSIFSRRRPN